MAVAMFYIWKQAAASTSKEKASPDPAFRCPYVVFDLFCMLHVAVFDVLLFWYSLPHKNH
jgi:hypothetical protein